MSKIKPVAGLTFIACICTAYASTTAMAESSEFSKVGNSIKATGGETVFTVTGGLRFAKVTAVQVK